MFESDVALKDAREAARLETELASLSDSDDDRSELAVAVLLTLAMALERNELEKEAMETYALLVADKRLGDNSRFRINLGNLHFKRSEYTAAIKMYKMALDKVFRLTVLSA